MSFLTYFPDGPPDIEAPRRVYARAGQREPADGEDGEARVVLFDSVDADWFDEFGARIPWLGEVAEEADQHISVVEARFPPGGGPPEVRTQEGEWVEIVFGDVGTELNHYLNLFAEPRSRIASAWWRPPEERQRRLEEVTSLGPLPDAPEDQVQ